MTLLRRMTIPALLLAAAACADPTGTSGRLGELPRPLSDTEQALIGANNTFAFSLFRQVSSAYPDSNLFVSPLSISMALGMTMNGAAGPTMHEMRSMLGFGNMSQGDINESYQSLIQLLRGLDPKVDFRLANSIWYDKEFPVEQPFVQSAASFFDAQVAATAFDDPGTVESINDWVSTATAGKIDEIIEDIPDDAVMYLLNAIYFKGDWTTQFDPQYTQPQPFAGIRGSVSVPLMSVTDSVRYADVNGTKIVDLPYGGGAFAMTVVLPPVGEDIAAFASAITASQWNAWQAAMSRTPVVISLPKFTLERDYGLNETLQALGMRLAFGGGDFTPMSQAMGHKLEVSEVKHKTFVDVHEEGTEAAAVTSVGIVVVCACGPTYPQFRADRPFVFAIRERMSGTILFMGVIVSLE